MMTDSFGCWNGKVGRFTAKDPIDFRGSINLYAYVDDPISAVDPIGLSAPPSPGDMQNCLRVKAQHPELWKNKNDKFAHCALACQITKEYGPWVANNCAQAKEVKDRYDSDPTSKCEPEDFDAGLDGIGGAMGGGDCVAACQSRGYAP